MIRVHSFSPCDMWAWIPGLGRGGRGVLGRLKDAAAREPVVYKMYSARSWRKRVNKLRMLRFGAYVFHRVWRATLESEYSYNLPSVSHRTRMVAYVRQWWQHHLFLKGAPHVRSTLPPRTSGHPR